jgi:TolA-binding protein
MEKKYPDSEKTPNAIFMIGYIYANELQDNDKAREAYEYFIENYPDNVLVQSARWEIENLGKSLEEIQQTTVTD